MDIKIENYFHCIDCDDVSYKFDCCGNSICNGSGCNICDDDELRKAISDQMKDPTIMTKEFTQGLERIEIE